MTPTQSPQSTDTLDTTAAGDPKVAAVQRLYAAFGRGDIASVLAELAEDVDWAAEAAGTGAPWYGSFRGRDRVPGFFAAIAATIDIEQFDVIGLNTGGSGSEDVIATVWWAFTVKATGRRAEMYMQHWWRVAEDRIVFFRGSEDSAQTVAALAPAHVEVVRAGYAAFAHGDLPTVLALFADSAQWYAPDELPTGGTFRGPAEIAAFLSALPAHYDELHVHPERFHSAGDLVVVEGRHTGRIAATPFDVGFVHLWTVQDGCVVEFREYMDSGKLLPLFPSR
jgi:ketosteroid isomerase-like protein